MSVSQLYINLQNLSLTQTHKHTHTLYVSMYLCMSLTLHAMAFFFSYHIFRGSDENDRLFESANAEAWYLLHGKDAPFVAAMTCSNGSNSNSNSNSSDSGSDRGSGSSPSDASRVRVRCKAFMAVYASEMHEW